MTEDTTAIDATARLIQAKLGGTIPRETIDRVLMAFLMVLQDIKEMHDRKLS
jgi:TolB-like protein